MKSTAELRQGFLEFFKHKDHTIVASSSLVPSNDPTLLFTNAGMVQFKETFLGLEQRPYVRAASSQRCVRAGGKHNDLENVGYTARHHTFFEMLGNFSFGDYFKREAIQFAWEFLTTILKLPEDRLFVTVFDEDDEAADIWLKEIGVDPSRFARIGAKDNFWSMGETGPCGPCSEIFYDHGPEIAGGPPGTPEEDGDRFVEIWNLVFMQFNRDADGKLTPLPKPSVDTGMGLERLAAVMQGVHSNYEIDLFKNIISATARLIGVQDGNNSSLRVIADHIRSCAFLIVDGVLPSNEGRGYVLRRIIRRAIRHGYKLGQEQNFFHKLVKPLVDEMGNAYPELVKAKAHVEKVLENEELRFAETLDTGMHHLKDVTANLSAINSTVIPGDVVFKLYDTFGFPSDLTADYARELNLTIDMDGFEKAMEAQRERARGASQFGAAYAGKLDIDVETEFSGYETLEDQSSVIGLFQNGNKVNMLKQGDSGMVVLERTPFYAESGGQVGDHGILVSGNTVFKVQDTQKQPGNVFAHIGVVEAGDLRSSDKVTACVEKAERAQTACNHSATHLMHAALRSVLGDHVTQKGSLVDAKKLRFDFSHYEPVTQEQLAQIEAMVNDQIRMNNEVETRLMDLDAAIESGAMALFGEKYDQKVRVLSMGDFSIELCGGTHVKRTGDIGLFKILSEGGVASGVRRIEAVSGLAAYEWMKDTDTTLKHITELVKGDRSNVSTKVQQLAERSRALEKEIDQLKGKLASAKGGDLVSQAEDINGIKVVVAHMEGSDPKSLRDTVDQLKNKLGTAVVILAATTGDKVSLTAGVTKDTVSKVKAGELVNMVAMQVGGKGGGRPDMAQAGGNNPEALDAALASVIPWIREQLS